MKIVEIAESVVDASERFKERRTAAQKARADRVLGRDRNTPPQHLLNIWSEDLKRIHFYPDEKIGKQIKLQLSRILKKYGDGKLTVLDSIQEAIKAQDHDETKLGVGISALEWAQGNLRQIVDVINEQLKMMDQFARRVTDEHPDYNWKRYTRYPQLRIALEKQLSFYKALKK